MFSIERPSKPRPLYLIWHIFVQVLIKEKCSKPNVWMYNFLKQFLPRQKSSKTKGRSQAAQKFETHTKICWRHSIDLKYFNSSIFDNIFHGFHRNYHSLTFIAILLHNIFDYETFICHFSTYKTLCKLMMWSEIFDEF